MSLGIILAPFGKVPGAYPSAINYSYGGNGTYLCPEDPQFNQRGEQGMYFDTQLGASGMSWWQRRQLKKFYKSLTAQAQAERVSSPFLGLGTIPTDAELSTTYGWYTPVTSGWVAAKEGSFPGQWLPPNGWNQAGGYGWTNHGYGPTPQVSGVTMTMPDGAAAPVAPNMPQAAGDVIAVLNAHNQRVFALSIVSTAAVAIAAMLGAFRTLKLLRESK